MSNPYHATTIEIGDNGGQRPTWRSILIGAAVFIATTTVLGVVHYRIAAIILSQQGYQAGQLYALLFDKGWSQAWSVANAIVAFTVSGVAAASLAAERRVQAALWSALVYMAYFLVCMIGNDAPVPTWLMVLDGLVLPLPMGILGAYLYTRRHDTNSTT
ncbi:MAG: hypothetical protein JO218_14610 [Burkholderiales bacterium]|nr:hypothetical protein [Burkholderiales bacterium]